MYMLSILIFYTVKIFFLKFSIFNVLNIYCTNSSVIIFEDMKIVVAIVTVKLKIFSVFQFTEFTNFENSAVYCDVADERETVEYATTQWRRS